jgi:hypothetical protein
MTEMGGQYHRNIQRALVQQGLWARLSSIDTQSGCDSPAWNY